MANDVQVSATIWQRGGGFKEQLGVVGGVIIYVCVTVVQGETMWPRTTVIGIEDSEVDCLFTHRWGWCSILLSCPDTIHMWVI